MRTLRQRTCKHGSLLLAAALGMASAAGTPALAAGGAHANYDPQGLRIRIALESGPRNLERLLASVDPAEREIGEAAALFFDYEKEAANNEYIDAANKIGAHASPKFWLSIVVNSRTRIAIGEAGHRLSQVDSAELKALLPELLAAYDAQVTKADTDNFNRADEERWTMLFLNIAKAVEYDVGERPSRAKRRGLEHELLKRARELSPPRP